MRILITGGAGMVGSHAAVFYAQNPKNEIVVLDNLMRSKLFSADKKSVEYNWEYLERFENVVKIKGDVRNKEDVRKAIGDGVDIIIHTAGQPGVGFSIADPREDFTINAEGTFNMLEATRLYSPEAAFIYCSTNKVYGENVSQLPIIEDKTRYRFAQVDGVIEEMPVDATGHSPYGVSKLTGDLYVQEYSHAYNIKCGVFRMSCIYGTRQFGFEDQGWIAHFIISAALGRTITIYGDGKQVRDLLYAEDLINAYDLFVKSPLRHAVFNVGGGPENTLSILELLDIVEQKTGQRSPCEFTDWRMCDQKVYISDISKIKKTLNWNPTVSPEDGIERLIEWVSQNRELF